MYAVSDIVDRLIAQQNTGTFAGGLLWDGIQLVQKARNRRKRPCLL